MTRIIIMPIGKNKLNYTGKSHNLMLQKTTPYSLFPTPSLRQTQVMPLTSIYFLQRP